MIPRPDYIRAITPFIDVPLVKILAGVRRCGKSTILEMIKEALKKRGIPEEHIISRKYTEMDIDDGFSAKDMYLELTAAIAGKGRCYLFLDELQEVKGWEKVLNSLLEGADVDIYVTGSNSKLQSGEISTYLSGRYVLVPVYTLSFQEYLTFQKKEQADPRGTFEEYLQYGGFPVIRNKELFDRVVRYIVENMGMTFSANGIVKFLKNEKRTISVEAVYNYLKWLAEAFIIYPCQRYDMQGKALLKTQEKYYLSDISFKYSQMGYDRKMLPGLLENIVFLEMKRRQYDVYIGKNGTKEIDFIGIRGGEKIYVQVCVALPQGSTRETDNLMDIRDHFHKYVVCMDPLSLGNDNGIEIIHIADFLLKSDW